MHFDDIISNEGRHLNSINYSKEDKVYVLGLFSVGFIFKWTLDSSVETAYKYKLKNKDRLSVNLKQGILWVDRTTL